MQRRTLDILFSVGGVALAALLFVVGLALTSNANFAKRYVTNQLSHQKITFKTLGTLTPDEKKSACVVKYAGKALTTGKQAECYANEFIGLHVNAIAQGKTYAELGDAQTSLRAQIAAAQSASDASLPALQKQLADLTATRETLFKGETLRGLLLTSYGFSVFGTKGGQVGTIAFAVAALLAVLSLAGFAHAFRTPKTEAFAAPEPIRRVERKEYTNA